MGLFGSERHAQQVRVAGVDLTCQVCRHDEFWHREAQLNTAVASFFDFDWANATASCYVCDRCGHIHWFLDPS